MSGALTLQPIVPVWLLIAIAIAAGPLLAVALLPMLGVGGMQLYKAETPGPMKDEKLTPRITETAKNLWYIYVGLNVVCTLSFWAAGMSFFDALCHSFATLALGGFSTHDASIGYFQSPAIELVAGFFSLVAAVNFALYFLAWRSRSLMAIFRDAEFQFCMVVMGGIIATTCIFLYVDGKFSPWESGYHGFFQAASVITDNGLGTIGYPADWPTFVPLLPALGPTDLSLHPAPLLEVRRAVRACDLTLLRQQTAALMRARDRAGIERWLATNTPAQP